MLRRVALVLPLALATFAFAAPTPPTDDAIDGLIKKVQTAGTDVTDAAAKRQARRDAAKAELEHLSLAEASMTQIQKILDTRVQAGNPELSEAIDAGLTTLAKQSNVEGAKAAEARLAVVPALDKNTPEARTARDEKVVARAEEALKHPGAAELFKSGSGDKVIGAISTASPAMLKEHHLLEALAPHITPDLSTLSAVGLAGLIPKLVEQKTALGNEKFESIRTSMIAACEAGLTKATKEKAERDAKAAAEPKPADGPDAEKAAKAAEAAKTVADGRINRLKDSVKMLNSAWAKGELLDHAAPEIAFSWSSGEKPIKSFADLKGKVVLIDFWATWCGPCVAAFPKVRELQARYAGYPVVILGVTSDQGFSMDRTDKKKAVRIDTKGDPAKEHALMKDFMKDMDMTWTVAFSDQNVFNPDFGVRGIPHCAILGPDGKVRFNNLYPNAKEESEKIDALLKEAKLPYPEQPYADPKKDEEKKN